MKSTGLQLSKFAIVGILNTLVDIIIFNLIKKFTKIRTVWASYISSTIAMFNSYILNKYWTFESTQQGLTAAGEAAKFFVSTIIGIYVIHNGVVWLASEKLTAFGEFVYKIALKVPIAKRFSRDFIINNFAKICGIGSSMIWNFLLYKFWVFK